MADYKKNPLIGSFRDPAPGASPHGGEEKTKEPSKVEAPVPMDKPGEVKKPAEPTKKGKEAKPAAAPAKSGKEAKPTEPPKAGKESEPAAAPAKPGKEAKAAAPTKDGKAVKVTAASVKTAEGKVGQENPSGNDELPPDFHLDIVAQDKLGSVTLIPLVSIDDFEDHPFPVEDNQDMDDLVASVKQVGILEPTTIIRNPKKPGRFEMVAGHRRKHAAQLAGLTHIPAIVRDMDHDSAVIYMVDSNLKRKNVPLSVQAKAFAMKLEAMKRKAGRRTNAEKAAMAAEGKKPMRSDEELAQQAGMSRAKVQRIVSVNKLEEPLKKMVDNKELPLDTAEQISQMKPEDQKALADAIEKEGGKVPSKTEAVKLKEESKAGTLTTEKIEKSVAPTKREVDPPLKVTLNDEDLRPYFPKGATIPDVKRGIFEALDLRKKAVERQKAKVQAEKEAAKKKPPAPAR